MSELTKTKLTKNERNIVGWAEFEYHPSAEEIAKLFWALDAEEQAYFFNYIGGQNNFSQQMHSALANPELDSNGKWAAYVIGEYPQ